MVVRTDDDVKNQRLGLCVAFIALVMVGVSFAAVPLYDWFCRVTGFAGTTQRVENFIGQDDLLLSSQHPDALIRNFTIRFDSNIDNALPWHFNNVTKPLDVKVGELHEAHYEAKNLDSQSSHSGMSSFNVTPLKVGQYFVKVECFCFTEQNLTPNQYVNMPLQFYIDPAILDDENMKDVSTITLSYHFYPTDSS